MTYLHLKSPSTGRIDLTDQRFTRWTVLRFTGMRGYQSMWRCRCECGTEKDVFYSNLVSGGSPSCGCIRRTHGGSQTRAYSIWQGMKDRCYKREDNRWADYGGRGITVCERWRNSFENFRADMGDPPPGLSLDRKDNNGSYKPGNCRWADALTQARNTRKNRWYEWKGERRLMGDIARMEGVCSATLRNRLLSGMTVEAAVADCKLHSRAPYNTRAKALQLARFAELTARS